MKAAIILLSIILAIAIPTHDKWSYKAMHDRANNSQSLNTITDKKADIDRK